MAISENLLLKKLSGHLGKQIVFKQYGNKTVVSKYPDMSNRKLSPEQKKVNKNMKKASEAARDILDDETLRNAAQVRLNVTSNRLYNALISEYFKSVRTTPKVTTGNKKKK
jgi:hypothetical protein